MVLRGMICFKLFRICIYVFPKPDVTVFYIEFHTFAAPNRVWSVELCKDRYCNENKISVMNRLKGFFYGIITSVTFGLIPLFTLPLMQQGMKFDSILFYRFVLATVALGIMMVVKKESFRVSWKDVPLFILLAFFYTASAMFLFWGYDFMGAGVATTIHFTYPVLSRC